MPSVSPTEIECWNIHRMPVFFFPRRKKKPSCSFPNRVSFCVWLKFHICDTLQSAWVSHHREGTWWRRRSRLWPLFYKRRMWTEGCARLHLQLIFSRELRLMSGSSELSALIAGICGSKSGRSLRRYLSGCKFRLGCTEFEDVYSS